MQTLTQTYRRFAYVTGLALVLAALAALAAPSALANFAHEPAGAPSPTQPALVRDQPDGYQPQLNRDASDAVARALANGYHPQPSPSGPGVAPVSTPGGFDWTDAIIGAGVAAVFLALVASLGAIVLRRRRRPLSPRAS